MVTAGTAALLHFSGVRLPPTWSKARPSLQMAERSDFHKAFMKPTEDCPSGFFRQGPPHREAAVAVRANRLAAMRSFHPRQELKPGSGWGAEVCAWCWEHGVGATKCRLVGLGMSGHGPVADERGRGGPDFDTTLVGKRVAVIRREGRPNDPVFAGVVTGFDAASGQHTIKTEEGNEVQAFLAYFGPQRLTITGAHARVTLREVLALTPARRRRASRGGRYAQALALGHQG